MEIRLRKEVEQNLRYWLCSKHSIKVMLSKKSTRYYAVDEKKDFFFHSEDHTREDLKLWRLLSVDNTGKVTPGTTGTLFYRTSAERERTVRRKGNDADHKSRRTPHCLSR
jgi:cytochrome c oxidase assembly protein Cox11